MAGLLRVRKRPNTLKPPDTGACQFKAGVPDSYAVRQQEGDRNDTGRRRSLSDPTRRKDMSKVGTGGLLGKIGNLLSPTPTAPRVYFSGKSYKFLPKKTLVPFSRGLVASYTGPYGGLTNNGPILPHSAGENIALSPTDSNAVLGPNSVGVKTQTQGFKSNATKTPFDTDALKWRLRNERAYGKSVSLYEYKNSDRTECTGDPIADVFAIHATRNSCILAVADGVGWGHSARRAAQCAVKGSMEYLLNTLYSKEYQAQPFTTADVFKCMTESLDAAQELIIAREGSLTTLCLAVVADVTSDVTASKALCVVNVGDSLAFVASQKHGVREVTVGCREYNAHRNIRFCDGALGPCVGENPDLENLTFSYTTVEEGDIVFLTSDGVSDNYDPVVAKKAVANSNFKSHKSRAETIFSDTQREAGNKGDEGCLPAFTPRDRQEEMARMMDEIIHTTELPSENPYSASALCSKLLQYVVNLTERKRAAHEDCNNIISICERERLQTHTVITGKEALSRHARSLPGKLDHATVVAYVVGGTTDLDTPNPPVFKQVPARNSSSYLDISVVTQQGKTYISSVE